jgi:microcystin-dependent protein
MASFTFPTGSITPHTGVVVDEGTWVRCDGSSYDGTNPKYAALWALINTNYGGTGITDFKVPNLGGRVAVGVKASTSGPQEEVGGWTGSTSVTLTGAQSGANHNHTLTDPGHTHTPTEPSHTHGIPITETTTYVGTHSEITGYGNTYHPVSTYHPAVPPTYDKNNVMTDPGSAAYYSDDSYWTYGDAPIYGTVANTPTGTIRYPENNGGTDQITNLPVNSAGNTQLFVSFATSGLSVSVGTTSSAAASSHENRMPTTYLHYLIKL